MSEPEVRSSPAEHQATELVASLDAVAEDLERNGPVPAAEVRRILQALYAELSAERASE